MDALQEAAMSPLILKVMEFNDSLESNTVNRDEWEEMINFISVELQECGCSWEQFQSVFDAQIALLRENQLTTI